jgi:hypothetical protein
MIFSNGFGFSVQNCSGFCFFCEESWFLFCCNIKVSYFVLSWGLIVLCSFLSSEIKAGHNPSSAKYMRDE